MCLISGRQAVQGKMTDEYRRLDGNRPGDVLKSLCDMSYELIVSKLPKYAQRKLKG